MNLFEARKLLELDGNYTEVDVKKNYRRLVMKYHPDKCSDPMANENFIKINSAYEYLIDDNKPDVLINNIKDHLFNSPEFKNIFFSKVRRDLHDPTEILFTMFKGEPMFKREPIFKREPMYKREPKEASTICITPKEYFTGTEKTVKGECRCEKELCIFCAGCGFSEHFNICMECTGEGWISNCSKLNCNSQKIYIPKCYNLAIPLQNKYKIILNDSLYFFENGNIYYNFEISLKESLIGFNKIFKDPFEVEHKIIVNNKIIRQNDGYSLVINGNSKKLILLFNIIYPKKFSSETIEALKNISF